MQNKIILLKDQLVHKIAAGEVIERPASAVKELLENSLDACAAQITISLNNGGKRLIKICDNGIGMNPQDALMALERHATSKIKHASDLFHINTLGFRGEALPSIAAVSRMQIITKPADIMAATQIDIEGGKIKKVTQTASPAGTVIQVKNLFYNVPARYKFLKSTSTELAHITQYIQQIALAYPKVQIKLYHHEKALIEVYADNLRERIGQLYGMKTAEQLIKIEQQTDDMSVNGYISPPQLTRAGRDFQSSFVNNRLIRDRLINGAIYHAYKRLIPHKRNPVCILFLNINPELIDVNVHPAKTQIRFSNAFRIRRLITNALEKALSSVATAPYFVNPPCPASDKTDIAEQIQTQENNNQYKEKIKDAIGEYMDNQQTTPTPASFWGNQTSGGTDKNNILPFVPPAETSNEEFFLNLIPIGQFHQTYILCQNQDELVIIDQHAAHEKIMYEKLLADMKNGQIPKQQLLFPQTLELSHTECAIIKKYLPDIIKLGFEISSFGGNTYILSAAPAYLKADRACNAIMDIIADLTLNKKTEIHQLMGELLHKIACHCAIRANQSLTQEGIKSLIEQLAKLDNPCCCPHGRPTLLRYHLTELNKQFKRT